MGEVLYLRDYKTKAEQPIRTRAEAVDAMAAEFAKMLEEGDTLTVFPFAADGGPVVLTCQNGEILNVFVEPPADCPA